MLDAPPQHDLSSILALLVGNLHNHRVVKPHCPCKRSPSFKQYLVLFADIHNLRMPHEGMEVNLVNGRQRDFLIDEFLDVLLAKVGNTDRLDKTLGLGIAKSLPDVLPDDGTANGGVHEVKVKILDTGAFEGALEVGKSLFIARVVLELRCKEDLLSRGISSLYVGIIRTQYAICWSTTDILKKSAMAFPQGASFSYHSAVSTCRYPASRAHLTQS